MKPGELKHSIVIQQPTTSKDAVGSVIQTWSNLVTARAKRVATGGGEFYAAQKMNEETQAVYTIRYYPGLTSKMRLVHGSSVYDILNIVPNLDERWLNLSVKLVD